MLELIIKMHTRICREFYLSTNGCASKICCRKVLSTRPTHIDNQSKLKHQCTFDILICDWPTFTCICSQCNFKPKMRGQTTITTITSNGIIPNQFDYFKRAVIDSQIGAEPYPLIYTAKNCDISIWYFLTGKK